MDLYRSAPGGAGRNLVLGSQEAMYEELDTDREKGCIRDIAHATAKTAALPCSTATSRKTAASSRPPASTPRS